MKKLLLIGGGLIVAISAIVVLVLVAGVGIVAVGASSGAGGAIAAAAGRGAAAGTECKLAVPADSGTPSDETGYDTEQIDIIKQIVGVGKGGSIPEKGWIIALMVAMQESGIRNLDHGDADSLGLMQQRPSTGWGTPAQLQNPQYAIQAFYFGVNGNGNPGLMHLENWDRMIPTVAAQLVQRSAYPDAYAKHQSEATRLIEKYKSAPSIPVLRIDALNTSSGGAHSSGSTTCPVGGTPGSIKAAGDDYPGRNWTPDVGSVAGGLARECVDFTAWRMRQLTPGFDSSNPFYGTWYVLGNGKMWGPSAAAAGYTVDRSPKAGDIAYWDNSHWGHVAFVTAVHENGTVDLEEYNWVLPGGGSDYSYHTRTISSAEPAGYIHFLDNPKHPMVPYAQSQVP